MMPYDVFENAVWLVRYAAQASGIVVHEECRLIDGTKIKDSLLFLSTQNQKRRYLCMHLRTALHPPGKGSTHKEHQ
jgi:hypothetical protein